MRGIMHGRLGELGDEHVSLEQQRCHAIGQVELGGFSFH
jgi:hypothetical protein